MVLPTCFVHIPAMPSSVTTSGSVVGAELAYATTNTNYFGATSCGLSSLITPTPSTLSQPLSTVKCALPALISGKAYSVTPVVYVTVRISSTILTPSPYTCDPVAATAINKGNFQFICKGLRNKDLGVGYQWINWRVPAAASVSIKGNTFLARRPTSTVKYVVNPSLAKSTSVPTTAVFVYPSTTITKTLASTSTVRVITGTTTCISTVTVTVAPPPRRRAGGANLPRDLPELLPASDSAAAAADADAGHDPAHDNHGNDDGADTGVVDLKERAATSIPVRVMKAAAAPTIIGKPDFVYPPYGVTTVYIKSWSTTTYTMFQVSWYYTSGPPVTTTISYLTNTQTTVTVTTTRAY